MRLDDAFGPEQRFVRAPAAANVPPGQGSRFFGEVAVDGNSGRLTVPLREEGGGVLFTRVLQPGRVAQ
ncbi:hypothetical protein ACFQ2B_29280 [Streptomyces stramineus]|uniref:hypothetical protein n=1 Tax=Streptomyces stramineus TaxID=173861 RepID=UPI0036279049